MRVFWLVVLVTGFAACDNAGKIKADVDTTVKDIKNAPVVDSLKEEGKRALDTVKENGRVLLDSSKRKGGRLLNEAGEGLKKLSKKLDSTK